ncbi:MAG TPA: carboxylesterase family protein [Albitalea sp.]|nr:carboxylesterase family protein [Albitalea sp.]
MASSALLALAGCASNGPGQRACAEAGPDVVCTPQGAVRGVAENGALAFKGLPFAMPPTGSLRWQPPAPPDAWQGVRDGSRFGAVCPQLAGTNVVGDEDCLTLNVWKPQTLPSAPLPVMVFFTGGGNHAFSGQGAPGFGGVSYNGERLVPEGVLYVSFNYRLGALGFLAHPALSAERAEKISGNYGSLDQIAMLRWLQQNIAAFGGDPKRILLFGTSAGGGNICALMTAPAARGLFHRAAMQASVPTGCELPTLADAEDGTGRRVEQALGCGPGATAACLRGKRAEEIVRAVPGTFGVLPRLYGPNVDGQLFPEQPLATIARGAHAHMPVIIGNSTQETMLFVNAVGPVTDEASYRTAIGKTFGADTVAPILAAYPAASYPSPKLALVQLTTDALFTCQSRRVARTLSRTQKAPVYRYLFAHALENDPEQKALGAVHTVEHPFFFPWQGKYRPNDADLNVQRTMVTHWTRFARRGDSGSPGGEWPSAERGDAHLVIAGTPAVQSGDGGAQCDFWDTVRLPWPHL